MMKEAIVACLIFVSGDAFAQTVVSINIVDEQGVGAVIGTVTISESTYGLVLTPDLRGLAPGLHGFHMHQHPSCESKEKDGRQVPALAAGGHLDPKGSNHHGAPWGEGHLGDLPPLFVDTDGTSRQAVLAPRLKASDLAGRSLMIHAGGDNHSDHPAPLGGGGARVACGVME